MIEKDGERNNLDKGVRDKWCGDDRLSRGDEKRDGRTNGEHREKK